MKIAFFSDSFYPELSGIADSILLTGTALGKKGHRVEYFVPSYSGKNYELSGIERKEPDIGPNIRINRMLSVHFKAPSMQGRAAVPNPLRGIFSRNKFDIIHSQSFFGPGLDALCLSKIAGVPVVGTNHTHIESFLRYSPVKSKYARDFILKYVIWYYNRCNFVTAPSEFLLNDMEAKGLHVAGNVVSNPIEEQFFNPRTGKDLLKKELSFLKFTILYVGRIAGEKNVKTLLEAFILFAKKIPEAELVIVGQGVMREEMEERAAQSGVSSRIKIVGPFLGEKKKKLYDIFHASDIFVMPSTSETQSMVALQAMAAGLPIVVARAGALPELAADRRGLIFEPDDRGELELTIDRLYRRPALREEMGGRGRLFVKKFSTQEIANGWEKLYNIVIKKYHAKP